MLNAGKKAALNFRLFWIVPALCLSTALSAQVTAPEISAAAAKNGSVVMTLKGAAGAKVHYTEDGNVPTAKSPQYFAPFLITSPTAVKAIAVGSGGTSDVVTKTFATHVAPGTLVWSDEFANATGTNAEPDPKIWTYDAGGQAGYGNNELEIYCAWGSHAVPCDPAKPNAYVGTDGYLHVVARKVSDGYTSARLKTQGLFSMRYGRIEARMRLPEGQGYWPAFWLLGNNIATVNWPACGEQDVMEHVDAPSPDWIEGSVHGIGFTGGTGLGQKLYFPAGKSSGDWHTYGMIWSEGTVAYYVDDPAKPYVTYTRESLAGMKDAVWPFDGGQSNFILLNLAVGGDWPKSPDATTVFPAEMLVDYVRVYAE